jgi:putative RecB family exonuclease
MEAFTNCPLAFRFTAIEGIEEPPSIHTVRGSFVHRVLELLFTHDAAQRTVAAASAAFDQAVAELAHDGEYQALGLSAVEHDALMAEARALVDRYFSMEDPTQVHAIGLELRMEADLGAVKLRGIIDRLDLEGGELVVCDYKTGRPPMVNREQRRLSGVQAYALMCERLLGRRPAAVRLLYLSTGEVIEARPTERHVRFHAQRTLAVHAAVTRACQTGDFRPAPSRLCDWCAFRPWCSAFGGDPDRARAEAPLALVPRRAA